MQAAAGTRGAFSSKRADGKVLVNLGSGHTGPDTWLNFDRSPTMILRRAPQAAQLLGKVGVLKPAHLVPWSDTIIRRNLTKPLPFADGTVDAVYSSHFLEHVHFGDAQQILREVHRVLKPGGVVRLALPDGTQWARELLEAEDDATGEAGLNYQLRIGAHPLERPKGKGRVTFALGAHIHLWQPTPGLVASMLREAGFTTVSSRDYMEGELPELETIETRPLSFFTEAVR